MSKSRGAGGGSVCGNRRTIKRTTVEAVVLDALCTRLMSPELFASFTRGFTAEWNREQGTRDAEQSRKRDELKRIDGKIGNLVAATANGGGPLRSTRS